MLVLPGPWRLRSRAALAPAWLAVAVSCRPASSSQSRPAGLGPRELGGLCRVAGPASGMLRGGSPVSAPGGYGLRCLDGRAVQGVPAGLVQLAGVRCSGGADVTGAESQHVEDRP